jgi:hypothetical protein
VSTPEERRVAAMKALKASIEFSAELIGIVEASGMMSSANREITAAQMRRHIQDMADFVDMISRQ